MTASTESKKYCLMRLSELNKEVLQLHSTIEDVNVKLLSLKEMRLGLDNLVRSVREELPFIKEMNECLQQIKEVLEKGVEVGVEVNKDKTLCCDLNVDTGIVGFEEPNLIGYKKSDEASMSSDGRHDIAVGASIDKLGMILGLKNKVTNNSKEVPISTLDDTTGVPQTFIENHKLLALDQIGNSSNINETLCVRNYQLVDEPLFKMNGRNEIINLREDICNFITEAQLQDSFPVVQFRLNHATRADLLLLKSQQPISSQIINLVVEALTIDQISFGRKKWYLPTSFVNYVMSESPPLLEQYIRLYKVADKYMGDLSTCDQIFIPFDFEKLHWYLCVVDLVKNQVIVLDNKPMLIAKSREKVITKVMILLEELLSNVAFDTRQPFKRPNISNFYVVLPKVQIADNDWDCGMYLIKYMQIGISDMSFLASYQLSDNARGDLLFWLLTHTSNESIDWLIWNMYKYKEKCQ